MPEPAENQIVIMRKTPLNIALIPKKAIPLRAHQPINPAELRQINEHDRMDRRCRSHTNDQRIPPTSLESVAFPSYSRHILIYVRTFYYRGWIVDDLWHCNQCVAYHPSERNHFSICWCSADNENQIRVGAKISCQECLK